MGGNGSRDRLRTSDEASSASSVTERELLEAACHGDQQAFRRLVEPHRSSLHALSYRMLGSLHDAEDALQEALLRAWRGLCGFDGRSALRTWLYRITRNVCLDTIARRPNSVQPIDHEASAYPAADEDGEAAPEARYEQREAVELAYVAALRRLPPRQRAVLILRDVLSLSAKEASESLGTTVPSVNSALQRARSSLDERFPGTSVQPTIPSAGDRRARAAVRRFADAVERGDVDAIVGMVADDGALSR
jgi:RNA polymerase sigma-70 factor, ECF subfamily